jgi:PAS domain S-box-containing protein
VPFMKKGKPYKYISIRTDISSRKKAESDLRVSIKELEDMYYAINQSSIVAITDNKGVIVDVNDKFSEISGYKRDELIGHTHQMVNSGYHSKEFFEGMWKTIYKGEVWKGEIRIRAKNGDYYWVDTTIVPFYTVEGKPYQFLAIRYDITERKRTEEMLHRQDKLAAVGQLAAGVAHEIRNPLTALKGFLKMIPQADNPQRYLEIMDNELNRIEAVTNELLVLAKPQIKSFKSIDLAQKLTNVLHVLNTQALMKSIETSLEVRANVPFVECEPSQLEQVFVNLIKNAIEATPASGKVFVQMTKVDDEEVIIRIIDNGHGIPHESIPRLGEPFFSTKENGTGLGLMVSQKIIMEHHGKLEITSDVGKGTTMSIVLPCKQPKN